MIKNSLNGVWKLHMIGKDASLLPEEGIRAEVPGTVYGALLAEKIIPDPYYRDNELKVLPLMENDFCFVKEFAADERMISCDRLLLCFEGLDTLADIYVNDTWLGSACNMHRTWEFDLLAAGCVREGENCLKVVLHSPVKYIREENKKTYTGGIREAMEGFPHLRKAHCMFGWDWGPRLPDAGIFREVSLLGVVKSRFESVYAAQIHEAGKVTLAFDMAMETADQNADGRIRISVFDPDGQKTAAGETECSGSGKAKCRLAIEHPMLWWPRGYGKQPLYRVRAELLDGEENVLDIWERRIGLRTMTVNTEKDEWGRRFAHEVNGIKIFAMGADYIPEDNLLGRVSRKRTGKLLEDAAWANHNCIRVWGGGYYPDDYFYDICDELGLIVWQDFMYACASYELDDAFEENIIRETTDNVRRIRHHACLGLWCGNNEMETQIMAGEWHSPAKQVCDYIKIYEYIIPKILKKEDPAAFYWPSSPSSGGNFDAPTDENRGGYPLLGRLARK